MNKQIFVAILVIILLLSFPAVFVGVAKAPEQETSATTDPTVPMESTAPTEDVLIDPSEWFVTDEKPSQFTDETYPPKVEETTEPTTEPTEPEPTYPEDNVQWYGELRVEATGEVTTEICGENIDRDFLAKMVFAESGGEDWWCQVYTCSAILNHCEVSNMTLWKCGHNTNHFAVAPYVDNVTPSDMSYEVVDYVLGGGRIEDICYFRTKRYHSFGTPICRVGAHYFSIE